MELHVTRPGTKVSVKDGMFEVTWFDDNQTLQKESHSPLKIKHLWIQDGAVITTAACLLALQHGIDLVIMDYHGMPMAQLQGFELHTTPAVQKAQVMVSVGMHAVAFVKNWVAQKLHNQAEFLEKLKSRRIWTKQSLLGKQAQEIWNLRKRILALDGATVKEIADELRGLEGAAGQIYFQTLGEVLPNDYRFEGRSKMPARDPFNSFLNFGYAILYGKTEKALLLAGVNAQIGFLHRDDYNKKSMVFDFIEPFRIWIDRLVFRLFSRKMVTANHTVAHDGGLYLNGAGRKLLIENINEFFSEKKEELDGSRVSRDQFLRQSAQRFARRLLQITQMEADDAAIA